jgi:transcriptional regulator with XRE-family HTH domain
VAAKSELSFGGLLRQLRDEAQLTQEELAEAATLSPRSVSDLERGINRTAHKDTALLLADALGLAGATRELVPQMSRPRSDRLSNRQRPNANRPAGPSRPLLRRAVDRLWVPVPFAADAAISH